MATPPNPVRRITQFARQAQYLSERENPVYSTAFKATMRYVPLAMRLYRFKHYFDMERDYAGFNIESGRPIRQSLAQENEEYVKRMAPQKYWDALIPKTEIGCKRKVLDTEYLKSLWRENVELVSDDPVERISEDGVVTRSGRQVRADAVVLAIGFATQQMLCPMEIVGREGVGLNDHVSPHIQPFEKYPTDMIPSGIKQPKA
jgi:cation diffusion facilitator CzcD-associated flavoprotein CzcO